NNISQLNLPAFRTQVQVEIEQLRRGAQAICRDVIVPDRSRLQGQPRQQFTRVAKTACVSGEKGGLHQEAMFPVDGAGSAAIIRLEARSIPSRNRAHSSRFSSAGAHGANTVSPG